MTALPREIRCDVGALAPDARSLDALARLQLTAKRNGLHLQLTRGSPELAALLTFAGLAGVLGLEASRKAKQGEQRLGLEEERHLGDKPPLELQHLQRTGLVARPSRARLVLAVGRRAVGSGRRDDARSSAFDAGSEPPGEDILAAGEPE